MSEQNSNSNSKLSRRNFLKGAAIATGAAAISGVPGLSKASKVFAAPRIQKGTTVRIAVGGWAQQNMTDLLAKTDFIKKSGIDVQIVLRTDTKETELAKIAGAVQA